MGQTRLAILTWRVFTSMLRHEASHLAAGVAYFALFSLFPLLLGFLAIMGIVLNSNELQQSFLGFVATNLPGAEGFVVSNVDEIIRLRGALGVGAMLGLFWSGSAVFAATSRAVNQAWGIQQKRPFYLAKTLQLVMAMVVGVLLILSTAASSFIQLFTERDLGIPGQGFLLALGLAQLFLYLIPWLISLTIFLLIYRFVPNCKTHWRYIWSGGVIAAALFEGGKFLFVWYLENFAIYTQVYGSLASVIALLFWAYLSSMILILGAEICVEFERMRRRATGDI